ncbi:MAG: hypothetical protein ACI8PZ_004658 [Myxococcota bacterium]
MFVWVVVASVVAGAQEPQADWATDLAAQLTADASSAERTARITRELGQRAADPDATDRLGTVLSTVTWLQVLGLELPDEVRGYIAAALCDDPQVRAEAASAARMGSPPPALPEAEVDVDSILFGTRAGMSEALPDHAESYGDEEMNAGVLAYRQRALARTDDDPWQVRDGAGNTFAPTGFAERVGDWTGRARLEKRRTTGAAGGIGIIASGLLVLGAGVSIATLGDPSSGQRIAGAGVAVAGAGLAGGGGGLIAVTLGRHRSLERSYSRDEADLWIVRHNEALRDELLLDPGDGE